LRHHAKPEPFFEYALATDVIKPKPAPVPHLLMLQQKRQPAVATGGPEG
jgi:hypothetical protein